jgi:hypothetical protein
MVPPASFSIRQNIAGTVPHNNCRKKNFILKRTKVCSKMGVLENRATSGAV